MAPDDRLSECVGALRAKNKRARARAERMEAIATARNSIREAERHINRLEAEPTSSTTNLPDSPDGEDVAIVGSNMTTTEIEAEIAVSRDTVQKLQEEIKDLK
ncbi:hypothetical protein LTR37_020576 [Vermiconidia calcicola]|uniref:Uncharacterized protein n=1 Tax=Vermiconidia calcicola TaxID=1690605 RepID=A0ACC3MAW0_9PEZI|nr:hypothetical protein LTR37_020576 [Vermiconidia calcicola]